MAAVPLALPSTPVLDVRCAAARRARHLVGSVHIPAADLTARRMELPPRGVRRAAPYAQLRAKLLGLLGVEDTLAPA